MNIRRINKNLPWRVSHNRKLVFAPANCSGFQAGSQRIPRFYSSVCNMSLSNWAVASPTQFPSPPSVLSSAPFLAFCNLAGTLHSKWKQSWFYDSGGDPGGDLGCKAWVAWDSGCLVHSTIHWAAETNCTHCLVFTCKTATINCNDHRSIRVFQSGTMSCLLKRYIIPQSHLTSRHESAF